MKNHRWNWFRAGRMAQVRFENGEDIAQLESLDRKHWLAISMPVKNVRFDMRTLELMDTDGDGRIRTPEVLAAIEFLKSRNVDLDDLFSPSDDDRRRLEDVLSRQSDLAKVEPSDEDRQAVAEWEKKGESDEVSFLGSETAAADAALAAVEDVVDNFFTPPDDMPLVTEAPDVELPLETNINPKYQDAFAEFREKCVGPVLGKVATLDRMGWKKIKAAFAPYREWAGSKPVVNAGVKSQLEDEERVLRYKLNLLEFLENYVNMRHLYASGDKAIFQCGTLRIDAKELTLCFDVESEGAHSALAGKSNCCVIYLKLTRPSEGASRTICAVVTAGAVAQLYAGRNGVFYDRDGKDWEACVTKVVESQVSLMEAFWAPWRKVGEGVRSMVGKFLGDKQQSAQKTLDSGAAMASSVAAIGIGLGMVGAAAATLMSVVASLNAAQLAISLPALVLVVSLPSVALTYFKLRRRDLGAILNACGWAVNRPMYFSMRRARSFTVCARNPLFFRFVCIAVLAAVAAFGGYRGWKAYRNRQAAPAPAAVCAEAQQAESKPAEAKQAEAQPAPEAGTAEGA